MFTRSISRLSATFTQLGSSARLLRSKLRHPDWRPQLRQDLRDYEPRDELRQDLRDYEPRDELHHEPRNYDLLQPEHGLRQDTSLVCSGPFHNLLDNSCSTFLYLRPQRPHPH
jgi:hypothetical protein